MDKSHVLMLYRLASFLRTEHFTKFFLYDNSEPALLASFEKVRLRLKMQAQPAIDSAFVEGYRSFSNADVVPMLTAAPVIGLDLYGLAGQFKYNIPIVDRKFVIHGDLLDSVFMAFNHSKTVELSKAIANQHNIPNSAEWLIQHIKLLDFITELGTFVDCVFGLSRQFCMLQD